MMGDDELQIIVSKILEVAKLIDEAVSQRAKTAKTYVIPFHPRFLLTFKYKGFKVNISGVRHIDVQPFINIYDNYIVLLSDFSIIRSIRHRGRSKLPMKPFTANKLDIMKAGTRLGEGLTGSFITYGSVEDVTINSFQYQIVFSAILNMIRPLARVKGSGGFFILPSPLSLTSLKFGGDAEQNIVYLAPSSSITLIDYRDAANIETSILGEYVECFKASAYFISCKFSQGGIPTPKCVPIGPFTSFTPIVRNLTEELVEYAGKRKPVLTNLLGILVLGSRLKCSSGSRSCYLLALSPGVPYIPEIEVMSLLGEPDEIVLRGLSDKLNLYLRVKKAYVGSYVNGVANAIEGLVRQFNATDEVRIHNPVINSMKEALIWEDQDHIYMPIPSFLMKDITIVKDIKGKISGSPVYPFIDPEQRKIFQGILSRRPLTDKWLHILNEVRSIINNHPLGIVA